MDFKKIIKKIIFPRVSVVIIFTLLATAGMVIAILNGFSNNPINYLIYTISFYALVILSIYVGKNASTIFRKTKKRVYNTKYGNKYMTDIDFKTHVSLYISLLLNLGNVGLNVLYGIFYRTNWFYVLAFYYATLTAMRFILALYTRKNSLRENLLGEWKRARICAAVLTLINLSLTGVVLMMMYQDKGFTYAGMLIYVMAAYSFYHITVAIIDIIKYRKYKSPIVNSVKMVKLAAALVSMLSLETAMLNAFGADMPMGEKRVMIAATGAGICFVVLGLSSYMIVESTNKINKLKENGNDRKQ